MTVQADYRLITNGQILVGFDKNVVLQALSDYFSMTAVQAQKIITGQVQVIQDKLDQATSDRIQSQLTEIGLDVSSERRYLHEEKRTDNINLAIVGSRAAPKYSNGQLMRELVRSNNITRSSKSYEQVIHRGYSPKQKQKMQQQQVDDHLQLIKEAKRNHRIWLILIGLFCCLSMYMFFKTSTPVDKELTFAEVSAAHQEIFSNRNRFSMLFPEQPKVLNAPLNVSGKVLGGTHYLAENRFIKVELTVFDGLEFAEVALDDLEYIKNKFSEINRKIKVDSIKQSVIEGKGVHYFSEGKEYFNYVFTLESLVYILKIEQKASAENYAQLFLQSLTFKL